MVNLASEPPLPEMPRLPFASDVLSQDIFDVSMINTNRGIIFFFMVSVLSSAGCFINEFKIPSNYYSL